MRIFDFRGEIDHGRVKLSASFAWEDSEGPPRDLTFEIEGVSGEALEPRPEPFAILAVLSSLHRGERRARVEGPLCPRLRDGLRTVMRVLRSWYPDLPAEPAIECSGGFRPLAPPPPRAGLFLSGGADSLAVLKANRDDFPESHPASFRDALFFRGFADREGGVPSPRVADLRARQMRCVRAIAEGSGLRLAVVRAPSGLLGEDDAFFERCSHGSHLASVAQLFSPFLSSVSIAASNDPMHLIPWGSHPLIDVHYGSSATEIRHEGFGPLREERVAAVGAWKAMLPHLIVCAQGPLPEGQNNCGRCEKCLRTMIALELAGALDDAPFPAPMTASAIAAVRLTPGVALFWEDFPRALAARGRADLARAVEEILADHRRRSAWFRDLGWKGRLRRLDRRILGGRLIAARRRWAGRPAAGP